MKTLFFLFFLLITTQVFATSKDIIVFQGTSSISQAEFDARINQIPASKRKQFLRDGSRVEKLLRELLLNRRIADIARQADFDKQEVIQLRLKTVMENELATAWLEHIELQHRSAADFTQRAREYYLTHKSEFKSTASVDVAHILIGIEKRTPEEAEKLALNLQHQLTQNPELWDLFVKEHSEDQSSVANGGKFLDVERGKMVKPFEDIAFSLKSPGDFSEPVRTKFGYHIIRLDAKNPGRIHDWDVVKDRLVAQQQKLYARAARIDYISEVNLSDVIVIPDCAIEKMMATYFEDNGVQESLQECLASTTD